MAAILLPQAVPASPYRITGMGAAETWEVKLIGKHADKHGEEEESSASIDLTAPIVPGLETSVTFGRGRIEDADAPARGGMLDTEWAVKWEVVPIREDRPFGATVEPALIIPTGTNGLGDDQFLVELPIIVGWNLGNVRLHALIGYEHSLESSEDEMSGGMLVEYRISPHFSVGGEFTTRMPTNAMREHKDIVDVGFKYELREGWELQGRLGQSVRTDDHVRSRDAALYLEVAL